MAMPEVRLRWDHDSRTYEVVGPRGEPVGVEHGLRGILLLATHDLQFRQSGGVVLSPQPGEIVVGHIATDGVLQCVEVPQHATTDSG